MRKQIGAALVEFAILLPLLVLIAFGITEYGRAVYQYDTLTKSVRSAARLLSQYGPDGSHDAQARCLAVFGNRTCAGSPLLPGLNTGQVIIETHSNLPTGAGSINVVTVAIRDYPFTSLVPALVPNIRFGSIAATMRQTL